MNRHGVPSTLTSSGRIVRTWAPGEADALTGPGRYAEIWYRLRVRHALIPALQLLAAAWRHGVALGGPVMRVRPTWRQR